MSEAQPNWIGRTIGGRYQIESLLGRGGMSSVYKAVDPNLQRSVAVKLIHPHLSEHTEFVKRFEQEAAAVAQLRHPHIVQVFDFNQDGDVYYMVMEHIPGETLDRRLLSLKEARLRMPLADAVRTLMPLCDALAYAHERNMVHRDVKPSNVIVNLLGQPILMDFGIAKIVGGGQVHTATGATIGTAAYMSPEQAVSDNVDHRADIYSLGVLLYEMASGEPPFKGSSALTVMMKHVNEPLPDIRLRNSNVPEILVAILQKALAKKPADRFQSAVEMGQALQQVMQQLPFSSATQSFVSGAPGGPGAAAPTPTGAPTPTPTPLTRSDAPSPATPPSGPPPVSQTPPPIPAPKTPEPEVADSAVSETLTPATSRRPLIWGAAAVVLLLVVAAGVFLLRPGTVNDLPTSAGMVNIPAGTYSVGANLGGANYAPVQQVTLESYWIDRFEVTNAAYADFVAETGAAPPGHWSGSTPPAGRENHPVEGVTWEMADAYCAWLGKRLPAEAEWEVAARGSGSLLFPWGNDANQVRLPQGSTYTVGSTAANRSDFGIFDMAGNVWEWVDAPYAPIPDGQRMLRGGAHDFLKDMAYRLIGAPDVPTMYATAGFRCAASEVVVVEDEESIAVGDSTFLIRDDFTDPASGWPEVNEGSVLSGYHPPNYYHVQSGEPNHISTAYFGGSFDDLTMEAEVFVDSTDTETGDFRYGLVVRRAGSRFYAFTISPRTGRWFILKGSDSGLETINEGTVSLQGLAGSDLLRVDARGGDFIFSVNGRFLARFSDSDYASGDVGFLVETFDESRAHIHYDLLTVRQVAFTESADVLLQDDFTDPGSGWPDATDGNALFGYHPPDFYHVQSSAPNYRSVAFFDQGFDDFTMESAVFVEATDTESGDFEYGLAVRREGDNYYAFLISPRRGAWRVIKHGSSGDDVLAAGETAELQGLESADRLRVDAQGANLVFHINGRPVMHVRDGDYSSGQVGFIVETADETRAHIHYNDLLVRAVDIDLAAAPSAVAGAETAVEADPEPTEVEPTAAPTPTPVGPLPSAANMIRVDGGTYILADGSEVTLDSFWLDRYEVTNAAYAAYLEANDLEPPAYWTEQNIPAEKGDHPVEGISWDAADAYCRWADKRLPAEAEWEAAARGPYGYLYPWGDARTAVSLPASGTYPAGSIPANRSYFGAFDMAGNVWEWVDMPYQPVGSDERVLRGGANNFQNDMTARLPGNPNSAIMVTNAGVRCAASQADTADAGTALILSDDFDNLNSGWWQARAPIDDYFYGYHPTDFYHMQISAPQKCLSIYREVALDNFMVEVQIFVAATETETGDFRYGLTLRENGNDFYALLVSPRSQTWQVVKSTSDGLVLMDEGQSSTIVGDSQETRDRLFAIANDVELAFFVNGELVSRVYDDEYLSGNVGFIVTTLDETYAHIHYDRIDVWSLPEAAPSPAAPDAAPEYELFAPVCGGTVSADNSLVNFVSHTVLPGETLSAIALRYDVAVEDIVQANGRTVDNPGLIRSGQTLVIPQS